MKRIKVFITIEVEANDRKNSMTEKTREKMDVFIDALQKDNIPYQYKETTLPRIKRD